MSKDEKVKIEEDVVISTEGKIKQEKIVVTEAKAHKKGLMERLVLGLIGPDGLRSVGSKLNDDIVKPAVKNIFVDAVTTGLQMLVYGRDNGPVGGVPRNTGIPRGPSYSNMYRPSTIQRAQGTAGVSGARHGVRTRNNYVKEFILGTREEASAVIDALSDNLANYGSTTVADYYDCIGVDTTYVDSSWGWRDLRGLSVYASNGGFILRFPPVEEV